MIQKIRIYIPRDYELLIYAGILVVVSYFILPMFPIEATFTFIVLGVLITKFKMYVPIAKKLYKNHPKTISEHHIDQAKTDKINEEKAALDRQEQLKLKKDEEFKQFAEKHQEELKKKREAKKHKERLKTIKTMKAKEKAEKVKRATTKKIDAKVEALLNSMAGNLRTNYLKLKEDYASYLKRHEGDTDENKINWLKEVEEKIRLEEEALSISPLYNYFGAVDGGETTFYYLKLSNKFNETRYKVGVTLGSVAQRYNNNYDYKILYENRLTHANTIEKAILKKYNHLVTDESLLGTTGTEIFREDVLKLDIEEKLL